MITIGRDRVWNAIRHVASVAFAGVIAGCGGGGSGDATTEVPPQTANGVTITAGSGIAAANVGDDVQQVIYVMPAEFTQRLVRVRPSADGITTTATVAKGTEILSIKEQGGQSLLIVDSTSLKPGDSRDFQIAVRNEATGTGADITGQIKVLTPSVIGGGAITSAGGTISDAVGDINVEFAALDGGATLNVTLLAADMPTGGKQVRVRFDRDVSADARVVTLRSALLPAVAPERESKMALGKPRALASSYPITSDLARIKGAFMPLFGFRLDGNPASLAHQTATCTPFPNPFTPASSICFDLRDAWALLGSPTAAVTNSEPVLFVHGFSANPCPDLSKLFPEFCSALSGGTNTWGAFPELVRALVPASDATKFSVFEFQWDTNAKFEQVADNLADAIALVYKSSGNKKVHIIAHSFGGVLVRAMLQGLGTKDVAALSKTVAQVITLGTPHSGIALLGGASHSGTILPYGEDSLTFAGCIQITCHEMGVLVPSVALYSGLLGVSALDGQVVAHLAQVAVHPLPGGIPFTVGIGLALDIQGVIWTGTQYRNGDGLISAAGQRFSPSATTGSKVTALSSCGSEFGPNLAEVLLDGDDGRQPGLALPLPVSKLGYAHSPAVPLMLSWLPIFGQSAAANRTEANIDPGADGCSDASSCSHASFKLVRQALVTGVCILFPRIETQPKAVSVAVGTPATFSVVASPADVQYQWRLNGVNIAGATSTSYTTTPTAPESFNLYSVVVSNSMGRKTSDAVTLTVTSQSPQPSAPVVNLVSPATMLANNTAQTLTISGTGFSSGNVVQFMRGTGSSAGLWATSPSATSVPSVSQILVQLNPGTVPDTINVRVCVSASQTFINECSNGTAFVSVTPPVVTPPTLVAPTPLAPTGTINSLTPVFSWSGGSGAANYEINVRDLTTNTIVLRQQGISTGSTSFTMPAGTLVNARQYRWDITTCPSFACSSGFVTSGNLTFTTPGGTASPTVTSVSVAPLTPTVGTQATFSVNGTNLQPGYVFSLSGCAATEVASASTSLRQFTCTPTLSGTNLSGTVSTAAGTVLYAFVQTVGAGVVLPLQRREIATGKFHSCALTSAGGVKCWGSNSNSTLSAGQLGDGTSLTRLVPVDVVGLSSGVVAVTAGAFHTCALTTAGGVKCWGQNFGALGDGTELHRLTPVDVVGLGSGVVAISAGGGHTCALTSTGGVKCWGAMGGYGLGDGTTQDRLAPVDVVGLAGGAVAIAAGNTHTCALTGAGGVKCWGGNAGRLGDGTDQDSLIPVDVLGLGSGVMAITAGGTQTCAVTNAGGAKCWGNNVSGALGDGTTVNRRAPVDVAGLTSGVVALSAGDNHTCAVTSSGGVKCWGSDLSGQLGDGAFNVDRLAPVDVTGLSSGVTAVSAGGQHTCARTSAGGVKCWGFNGLGGLGDGTTNSRAVPLDVVGFQPAGNNPFMGNYAGSYAGGQSGTWAATISVDGTISATATGGFVGTGSVNSAGTAMIALAGTGASQGFTITFSGAFALQSNGAMTGSGTWTSSSGLTGTWAGARLN